MNNKRIYLLLILLASILVACGAPAPILTAIPTAIATSTPVPVPPPSTQDDPTTILQGFWEAINAKNVDAAMAFVADDVVTRGGPAFFSSKAEFSAFMLSEQNKGNTFEIIDLKIVSEDTVSYTMKVYTNGILLVGDSGLELQVKDGKIVLMEFPA